MDYSALRDYLAEGDVRKADDETRALLIKMAGQGAVQRGWVYFTGAVQCGAGKGMPGAFWMMINLGGEVGKGGLRVLSTSLHACVVSLLLLGLLL